MLNKKKCRAGHAAQRAFTIVEAVMVMVILGMIGMMAMPRYSAFAATQQLEGAARRITADLSLAQKQARRTSTGQPVTFNLAQSRYQLVGLKHPDHPKIPFDIGLGDEPYRARIVSVSFGGDAQLVYDGFGKPDSAGQVVIAVGAYQKTIEVDLGTGRARALPTVIVIPDPVIPVDPIEPIDPLEPPPHTGGGGHVIAQ